MNKTFFTLVGIANLPGAICLMWLSLLLLLTPGVTQAGTPIYKHAITQGGVIVPGTVTWGTNYWQMAQLISEGTTMCADVVGGTPVPPGSSTVNQGTSYTYLGSGLACKQSIAASTHSANYDSYNFSISGTTTNTHFFYEGIQKRYDGCANTNPGSTTNYGTANCECNAPNVVNPDTGACEEDNQCDLTATPAGSMFTVNIFTGDTPQVCMDNCVANTGTIGVGLPYAGHTTWTYETTGDTCNGSEFGPDGADFNQVPPESPTCRTVSGHTYCFNPADNNVTIDGVPVWDFDQGDFADGLCSITGAGSIICDSTVYPGGDNSDTPPVNFAVDTDGDGQIDVIIIDETPTGLSRIAPGTSIDTNGDGQPDAIATDEDGDGVSDGIVSDENNDGVADLDDPSTPEDESNPENNTPLDPGTGGGGSTDNDTGDCVDNPNTPWNECDTDGDDTGGDSGDGSCTDDPNTPWNDCNVGVDLDGCSSEPEITGDPLQAAAIYLAWQSACAGYVPPDVAGDGQGLDSNRPEDDGSFLQETFDIPSVLDQSGFLGGGSGLPDYDVNILGSTYSIAFSKLDGILGIGGNLLVIISLLWGGRILLEV